MHRLFSLLLLTLFTLNGAQANPQVLTSIKPLQLIAAAVQGDLGPPQSLLPPGASAHHYSLRPSDIQRITDAELFYWIGPNMETFLTEILSRRQGPSLAVQNLAGITLQHFVPSNDNTTEETEEADAEHQPGALDAHLWLSSQNARRIAQRMAEDLARLDPEHATTYQGNAKQFSQRLDELDQHIQKRLAPLVHKPFFVFHEAYNYFEAAYGLHHQGAFHLSEENTPGARHVAELRQQLQQAGPCCVFSEPPLQPRLAQTLSAGLPVTLAEWDALGFKVPVTDRGYEQLLMQLTTQLAQCLESR